MDSNASQISVASQPIDRVAFVAYFLGAIIPLLALAYMTERYVLLESSSPLFTFGTVALIVAIGCLSLAAYGLLRRSTRKALDRMEADKLRLAGLLEVSGLLSLAPHRSEAARLLTESASKIASADAAFVRVRDPKGEFDTIGQRGPQASELSALCEPLIAELTQRALSEGPVSSAQGGVIASAVPLGERSEASGALIIVKRGATEPFAEQDLNLILTLAGLGAVSLSHAELRDVQRNFYVQLTDLVLVALDHHLEYQEGHSRRVASIANGIGRRLGFSEGRLERLHFAALLHDVGVLKMAAADQQDQRAMRPHPVLGARMLQNISAWSDLAPFVLHHHEHWDGGGYPEGIAGEDIPLESRIIGLAEAFDSMTSSKSYKEPVSSDEAQRRVREASGSQFDPQIVDAFVAIWEQGQIEVS